MMDESKKKVALEQKREMKRARPRFERQDYPNHKRLTAKWRAPKGHQSKQGDQRKGQAPVVKIGYGTPSIVKGMHRNGLTPVMVHTAAELSALDNKHQCAVIGGTVGTRKRMELAEVAKKKGVTVLNMKNPDEFVKGVKQDFEERKKSRKVSEQKRAQAEKKAAAPEKKETKEHAHTEHKDEESSETKEEQKKEFDKLLTKRDA